MTKMEIARLALGWWRPVLIDAIMKLPDVLSLADALKLTDRIGRHARN